MKTHLVVLLVVLVCVIVGGEFYLDAVKNQFPYHVSLWNKLQDTHFCSGVIINSYIILSSDLCASFLNAENIEARCGIVQIADVGKRIGIKKTLIYQSEGENSVALFYTKEKILFSESIQPIHLPSDQWSDPNRRLVVSGWDQQTVCLKICFFAIYIFAKKNIAINNTFCNIFQALWLRLKIWIHHSWNMQKSN